MNETNKEQIAKAIFQRDIEAFGRYFFPNHLTKVTPQFHKEIFQLYQGDKDKIAIGAPRGHSKTTITDLVYLAWIIVHRKARFVLLVSDTYSQATLFLDALKAEFEGNEKLQAFYGRLASDNWSEGEIVTNGIMIKALGAGMKVRGLKFRESRPDLLIIDDIENDEMVDSMERRGKLERWFNGALMQCLAKGGRVLVIGTILHYDSLLAKLLDKDQYQEFEKRTYKAIGKGDKALWPEHLSLEELLKIKQEFISKGQGFLFYSEYQNDPVSGEHQKFKHEKMKFFEESILERVLLNSYLMIDRAYSLEKVADYTGIVVVSVDQNNNWYVREAERFKGLENELIDRIFFVIDKYKIKKTGIEQKAFKYTLQPTLEQEMKQRSNFFLVEELKDAQRSKEKRIEGLLPRYEVGTIFLKRDQKDLIDELTRFPRGERDDLADALAYGLQIIQKPSQGSYSQSYIPKKNKFS